MLFNSMPGPCALGPWRSLATPACRPAAMLLILAGLLGLPQPVAAADGNFVNLSTRALVETGEEVMIGGFIVEDGARQVLIQAIGPELADRGISNALADPVLTVIQISEGEPPRTPIDPPIELMVNDNWEDNQGQLVSDLWGGNPNLTAGSLSSAAVLTLDPGGYTAKVEGKNGTTGVAIVEVYEIDSAGADGNFVNLSTRALVEAGEEVMIGGFIIEDGSRQVLIQALAPELADRGISNALADSVLTVIQTSEGEPPRTPLDPPIELMVNDNWEDSQGQLVSDLWGGNPNLTAGSLSSAAVLTLDPGGYTAKVEGKDGTTGVAIVEMYGIDSPDEGDPDFAAFSGLRIGEDGSVTLRVGGITLSAGNTGCISGGANLNGLLYDYHWTAWQHNTGSGWTEVSDSRRTDGLCGYDLTAAPAGRYRLVGDMTLAGVRGLYMSENEVTVEEGTGHAPADQAAFDTLAVGKQVGSDADNTLVFLSPGRIREITDGTSFEGNYEYINTGANTGTLTYTYDATGNDPAVEKTVVEITFTSKGGGTFVSTYTEAGSSPEVVSGPFELTDTMPDPGTTFRAEFEASTPAGYSAVTLSDNGSVWGVPERYTSDSNNATVAYMLLGTQKGCNFANEEADRSSKVYIRTQQLGTLSNYESKSVCRKTSTLWTSSWAGVRMTHLRFFDESSPTNVREYIYDAETGQYSETTSPTDDGNDLTGMDFDLDPGNRNPEDITFANDKFHVLDGSDDKVYTYNASGQRDAASEFDLDPDNRNPTGITFANDKFYVVDQSDDKVYAYNASGQRVTASEFDLDPGNRNPEGITFANDKFHVPDGFDDKVYAYNVSGQRDAASEFDLDPGNRNPEGITFANDRLYVPDGFDDEVYAYNASGQRDSLFEFDLDPGNDRLEGITFANGKFHVLDGFDDKVYAYNASGQRDAASEFDLDPGNRDPEGITFANDRLYVPDGFDDKVYAYNASGQRDTLSEFDLDPGNRGPEDITFGNDKFYVLDGSDDKVYAYNASGQRDAASEFDLDPDNRNPAGITFANGKFHVLDGSDDKVYTYNASGQRDAASEFDLDPGNRNPEGITFANERFHVADSGDLDWVFAYHTSGQSDAASDFHLDSAITSPSGITFGNGRFYVLNSSGLDRVYVVASTQQSPELVVRSMEASDDAEGSAFSRFGISVITGGSFRARTTVLNRGTSASAATTLRFFRSDDGTISTSDTEVGTITVETLSAAGTFDASIDLTAPSTAGTYYYGACIESVAGESDAENNCSRGVRVTVREPAPDLVVESASVSDDTPDSDGSFMLSVTVRNLGTAASTATTLRYYRSDDRTVSTSDTEVGMVSVGALGLDGAVSQTISLPAPATEGTYYYGACVDSVSGESNTSNNCSNTVVVFGGGPFPAYDLEISRVTLDWPFVGIIGRSSIKMTVEVVNQGPNPSQPAKLRFSGGTLSYLDIPVLQSGERTTFEDHIVGKARIGTTTYRACIVEAPAEENTGNNCDSRSVTYTLASPPDEEVGLAE